MTADKINTFIFSDWNRSEEEVVQAFQNSASKNLQFRESFPVPQELYGRACLRTVCNNPRSRHFRRYVMNEADAPRINEILPAGFQISDLEIAAYDQRRRTATGVLNPWAREFTFSYTGGDRPRKLKLLYFSDEGLARYSVLYHQRRLAPWIVCTIQSGPGFGHGWAMLEEPGKIFEMFLRACNPRPAVWIRKVWDWHEQGASHWNRPLPEIGTDNIQAFARDPEIP